MPFLPWAACAIVFALVYFYDARRRSVIRQINDVLVDFSEGRYDARVSCSAAICAKKLSQLNASIEHIEKRVFRQRSRDHAISVIMNQMQSGIIVVDARLHILLATPVARKLLGIAPNSEGVAIADASKDVNLDGVFAEAMRREGVYTNEVAARTAVGRGHRPLRLYVSPMRQDGKVVGALAMVEDITELRRLEQVRTDFVANVSHELKTPLTSIKGFVETLLDGAISNPQMAEKFLKIIMLEAERLTRLINDILLHQQVGKRHDRNGLPSASSWTKWPLRLRICCASTPRKSRSPSTPTATRSPSTFSAILTTWSKC